VVISPKLVAVFEPPFVTEMPPLLGEFIPLRFKWRLKDSH